jgi:hypothetical protein
MESYSFCDGIATPKCNSLLCQLSAQPVNIPRKEQRFYTYLERSYGIKDVDLAQEAWRLINIVDQQIHARYINFSSPNVSASEIIRHSYPKVLHVHRLDQETSGTTQTIHHK